jgi:hypothetical protein
MVKNGIPLLVIFVLGSTLGNSTASAVTVLGGSDYLTTVEDTFVDFSLLGSPLGLGLVAFEGRPTGPGDTDTIIRRSGEGQLTGTGDTDTVDIELVSLSLQSVSPVVIGGNTFDITIGLDGTAPSLGQMDITLDDESTPSGSFTSFFDIFFEITLVDATTQSVFQTFNGLSPLRVESTGNWTSVAPLDYVAITGTPGDTMANTHDPLTPGYFDFYVDGLVFTAPPDSSAQHAARTSVIPEPGTATILCLGALGMGIYRRCRQGY